MTKNLWGLKIKTIASIKYVVGTKDIGVNEDSKETKYLMGKKKKKKRKTSGLKTL